MLYCEYGQSNCDYNSNKPNNLLPEVNIFTIHELILNDNAQTFRDRPSTKHRFETQYMCLVEKTKKPVYFNSFVHLVKFCKLVNLIKKKITI